MAEFPALPLWTDAYLADCGHLNDAEHGRYLLILMHLWRSPHQRFPNDYAWIARKLGRSLQAFENEILPLMREFMQSDGNWWTQKRLSAEWEYVRKTASRQSAAAKARWNKIKQISHGNAERHTSGNAPTPTPTPTPTLKKEEVPSGEIGDNLSKSHQVSLKSAEKENFAPDGAPVLEKVNGNADEPRHPTGMAKPSNGHDQNSGPARTPLDLKAELWRVGKTYLAEHGITERQSGSLIGKWRKQYGDHEVLDALTQAQTSAASEPIAYIEARFRKKSSNGNGHAKPIAKKIIGSEYGSREWWDGVKDCPGYLPADEYSRYEKKYGR